MKKLFSKQYRSRTVSYLMVLLAYIIIEVLLKTNSISSLFKNLLVPVCCYIVGAIALNLVVGFSGELSLGHAGFMSIGAFTAICVSGYTATFISSTIIRLALSMLAGGLMAAVFGFLIGVPVLKLKGDYLSIVTLAFCQIIKSLITNIYIGFDANGFQVSFMKNELNLAKGGKALISGALGATGTERISNFTAGTILIFISLAIVYNLIYSRNGRAIQAARDNHIAALSVGINTTSIKMLAFVTSALLAGMAGALYGLNYATITPAKFDYNQSIMILVYVVFGGLGNINGTLIATTVLVLMPELLRSVQNYRMIIYAVLLIAIMLVTNNKRFNEMYKKVMSKFRKGTRDNG